MRFPTLLAAVAAALVLAAPAAAAPGELAPTTSCRPGSPTELRCLQPPWRGENLAYGYLSIRSTFAGWLSSSGHRSNILNPSFREYGSAYRIGFPRLWVIAFGG